MPPSISPGDLLLASRIPLPTNPTLACAVYTPHTTAPDPHDALEFARRTVISHNASLPLLEAILPTVQSGKVPALYLFILTPHDAVDTAEERLSALQFDHLHRISQSTIRIEDLPSGDTATGAPTLAYFFDALRSAIISELSGRIPGSTNHISSKRLNDGFILERSSTTSDWASGWNQGVSSRPLVHFRLQIQISYSDLHPSHLVLHAIPQPTPYSGLPSSPNPGSPIILMPYGTPAYFLSVYNGPSNSLVKQFRESLKGLGAGDWEGSGTASDAGPTPFIIGWIRVENRQGEDKGTLFVWPSRLCLSYSDACSHRAPLNYIPEMPTPLQSSPQVPAASHEGTALANALDGDLHFYERAPRFHFEPYQTPPHSDPLRAFHSLTTSKSKDLLFLASEVGGYVDSVVRERERERERLKKERESGSSSSPKLSRPSAPISVPQRPSASTSFAPPSSSQPQHPIPQPVANLSHAHQAQIYYPSPPQSGSTHPMPVENTSPDVGPPAALPPAPVAPPIQNLSALPLTASSSTSDNFDPFGNSGWQQSSDSYMDMSLRDLGIDMDMDFNMDMGNSRTMSSTGFGNTRPSLNFDDPFTDDDFSFFDQPSKPDPTPAAPVPLQPFPVSASSDFNFARPSQISVPPIIDEARASGPGPPSALHAPWTPATHVEAPTPRDFFDHRPSDLMPPTPAGPTPNHHNPSPETPTIQLAFDSTVKHPAPIKNRGNVIFDPIPFSTVHRDTDSKYSFGKFALPTPSPEPGYDEPPLTPPPNSSKSRGWKGRYDRATDPRFGVVKQLIGVKRKASPTPNQRPLPSWLDTADDDEWTSAPSPMDVSSDSDSDAGNEDESECDSPLLSRPSTPPPSYLPLGPTLLHFQFDHSQLLPLSTPLRSPGAIALSTNPSASTPFPSVPTPVSPAAALGAASEQSKSLESAAYSIATEFVLNPLWADTWKANNQRAGNSTTIWPDDIKAAAQMLRQAKFTEGLSTFSTIFSLDDNAKLEPYEPPAISIGKGDAVIQLLPSALRFWEKLGLGPKGGRKEVEVYAFYEDQDDQKRSTVDAWLSAAAASYKARHMGQFIRGCTNPANNALIPIRFDSTFRKTLATFVSSITDFHRPIVLFLFVPVTAMTMASPVLRQVLSSLKKALKNFTDGQVLLHFIPDSHLVDIDHSPRGHPLLEELCNSVYNRVRVSVDRNLFRPTHVDSSHPNRLFQDPTFTLARPAHSKVTYIRATHASLGVTDRFTLLHIGYQLSPCKKWVLACCVDQRGEEYALDLWLMDPVDEDDEEEVKARTALVISRIWKFALDFARKVDVEWQMVFTKLGLMSSQEIDVWTEHFNAEAASRTVRQVPLHAVLLSADANSPWTFVAPPSVAPTSPPRNVRTPASVKNVGHFNDATASFFAVYPQTRTSIITPPSTSHYTNSLIAEPSSTASLELTIGGDVPMHSPSIVTPTVHSDEKSERRLPHPIPIIPLSTSSLIRIPSQPSDTSISMLHIHALKHLHQPGPHPDSRLPDPTTLHADITRNFYELAVLSSTRFRLDHNPILPFHLAAVDAMRFCLDCDWEHLEGTSDP